MTQLIYIPAIKVPVSSKLRNALLIRLWPKQNYEVPVEVDSTWIPYFNGLKDAGLSEAEQIVDDLKKHEKICFTLEK